MRFMGKVKEVIGSVLFIITAMVVFTGFIFIIGNIMKEAIGLQECVEDYENSGLLIIGSNTDIKINNISYGSCCCTKTGLQNKICHCYSKPQKGDS